MKVRIFLGFVFIVLVLLGSSYLAEHLVITLDDSTPYTLYWKQDKRAEVRKGDYVMIKSKGLAREKCEYMTKRVLCVGGEVIKRAGVDGKEFYCCSGNECVFLHRAKERTPSGRKLDIFKICDEAVCERRLLDDELYLGTIHPDGYDSRYLGLFRKEEIINILKPIF